MAADPVGPESLVRLSQEIERWKRVRRPAAPDAMAAFEQALLQATSGWVARWPGEELAWRERLRALARAGGSGADVAHALAGAEDALGRRPALRFPVDTRLLMAEAAVRSGVRLADVPEWLEMAEKSVAEALPRGDRPLVTAYRRERLSEARWRSASVLAALAYRLEDRAGLVANWRTMSAESAVPVLDPADRVAVAERARRRTEALVWRARLALLAGEEDQARRYYEQALAARPVHPGRDEPPEHELLLEEAARLGAETPEGTPIPPPTSAGPHWLPAAEPFDGFEPDGRPAVAAIWDGESARIQRAIERLQRQSAVRIQSFPGAKPAWIRTVNPLYAAPQLWVVDRSGVIRLVGRLQPGGDGWEHAVTGAALRLD